MQTAKDTAKALPTAVLRFVADLSALVSNGIGWAVAPLKLRPLNFGSFMITSVGMFGIDEVRSRDCQTPPLSDICCHCRLFCFLGLSSVSLLVLCLSALMNLCLFSVFSQH